MSLALKHIDKIVGNDIHLKDIDLQFEAGSRNVILGRTLAGKTSLLRIMAGLDRPTRGSLIVDGQDVTGVSVRKRNVAMVYQQFVNYPSLSVYKNIASPLKIIGMPKAEIDRRVHEVAAMLKIEDLLNRLPQELSGGQQQRTAIARSIVKDASLLLLDEPLVNLDYKLREELRSELQDIFRQRQAIVVYTTTEPAEALMLGGNIVVMDEGRVLQTGPTADVYHRPAVMKVAEVFSDPPINYLHGAVSGATARLGPAIEIDLRDHPASLADGNYVFGIRSNHLSLRPGADDDIRFRAVTALAEINGSETFIHIDYQNTELVVQEEGIYPRKIGGEIDIYVPPRQLYIYDTAGDLVYAPSR